MAPNAVTLLRPRGSLSRAGPSRPLQPLGLLPVAARRSPQEPWPPSGQIQSQKETLSDASETAI